MSAAELSGAAFVSRRVIDGARPSWVYRCEPLDNGDTGWRFFEGNEAEEWLNAAGGVNCILTHLHHVVDAWPELMSVVADSRPTTQWEWNARAAAYDDVTDAAWEQHP